ncbi:alpha/beta-hydrolase [Cucurbitaria berberidis CBS 394.84]|uniref:Alpha/beta-hydrolase n=1 Tax=Cucurbitaria berberidis CBS 394.84 TaxID=1168544 RepID=A0A9P4LBQ4_9PLEO|nr:alpha/beta-hydrolase [Cucurbitaria berberidis CBS 394.84]KAF1848828.1 alpha/beta-hydrolase [Cucurbitaria berberidis CBS 394.84]
MSRIASFVAIGLLASAVSALPSSERWTKRISNNTEMIYSFEDLPHSTDLQWTPCYDRYHCANLEVPLDYAEPDVGTTIVAFIRQKAANSTGQDVIFNPGGPGGSGIEYILSGGGDQLVNFTGGKYDVVSFDPRGVNNSGIALTCFPDNPEARDAYYASLQTSLPSLNEQYYQAVALGQWCMEANNDTFAKYAGTSAVVQDMMHFTELQAALDGVKKPEEAEIWYIGGSYGTVIGHTLAAMYPDRIGRIVVDANVNSEDHYNGLKKTAIEDADDCYGWFFDLCYKAGLEKCAFAGKSGSASDIKKRFDNLLAQLEKAPVVLNDTHIDPLLSRGPQIVTKDRVLTVGFRTLYRPFTEFAYLAKGLAGLEKNNATAWIAVEQELNQPGNPGPFNYTTIAMQEVLTFVTAVDAAGRSPIKNVDDYIKVAGEVERLSVYAGKGYASTNVLITAGLNMTPPKSQRFLGFKKTKTKTPIFFMNPSADPITPIASAKHMLQFFEGSVLLEQNSVGHSVTSGSSLCTLGHLRRYLNNATLPKAGTVCETDTKPLVDSPSLQKRSLPFVPMHLQR